MKLRQDQVWKLGDEFIRIVLLERLAVEYKLMKSLETRVGTRFRVTKKQFCKLIKPAVLLASDRESVPRPGGPPAQITPDAPARPVNEA